MSIFVLNYYVFTFTNPTFTIRKGITVVLLSNCFASTSSRILIRYTFNPIGMKLSLFIPSTLASKTTLIQNHFHPIPQTPCVGQAIVQGDEGPVSGVAQGVEDHGVAGVRHEEEKEEGEVEQEVEGEKEENNTQGRRHMCMDGMEVKRQMRSALSQSEDVNTSDDATTDCVQCAQCCMVSSSACVALFTLLFTMRSMSVRMCL